MLKLRILAYTIALALEKIVDFVFGVENATAIVHVAFGGHQLIHHVDTVFGGNLF
jgi:hypothetical protein